MISDITSALTSSGQSSDFFFFAQIFIVNITLDGVILIFVSLNHPTYCSAAQCSGHIHMLREADEILLLLEMGVVLLQHFSQIAFNLQLTLSIKRIRAHTPPPNLSQVCPLLSVILCQMAPLDLVHLLALPQHQQRNKVMEKHGILVSQRFLIAVIWCYFLIIWVEI